MAKKLLKSENRIRNISFKVKSVDKVNFTVDGVFSAEVEDRQGEIVVQSGWLLENYMKNPVVLWAHKSDEPPIAKMLQIGVNGSTNQLEGKMQFAVNEYDFAGTIFKLIDGGYQSAFSAGFINNKYEIDQQNDKVYLVENELLEMSVVPVPANQLALAKSKGIDVTKYKEMVAHVDDEESPSADVDDEDEDEDEELAESGTLSEEEKAMMDMSGMTGTTDGHKHEARCNSETGNGKCLAAGDPSHTHKIENFKVMENQGHTHKLSKSDMTMMDNTKEAIEIISKSNMETIKRAIGTLTEVLKAHTPIKTQVKVGNSGDKKIPVRLLNRAIRELLVVKKSL